MMHDSPGHGRALSTVMEAAPMGMLVVDREGRVQYGNAAAARLLGREPTALAGLALDDELAPLRPSPAGAVDLDVEHRGRCLHAHLVPIGDDLWCCYLTDVTTAREVSAQRERTRRILDAVTDAFYTVDADYRVTDLNASFERLLARPREAIIGRAVWELTPPDRHHIWRAQFERALREHVQVTFGVVSAISGAQLHVTAYPAEDGLAVFVQDVTGLRRAEAALHEATTSLASHEKLLDLLFDSSPVGIAVYDAELRFRRVNRRLAEMNGLPAEAHVGRTVGEVLPPAAEAQVSGPLEEVRRTGRPQRFEVTDESSAEAGAVGRWSVSQYPMLDDDGRVVGIGTIVEDVTERRRAEEALRKHEAQLAEAQASAGLGSWEWDGRDGVTWSAETFRITGFDPAAGAPTDEEFLARVHPDDAAEVRRRRARMLAEREASLEDEFRVIHPERGTRWLQSRVRATYAPDGSVDRIYGTLLDVTELRESADAAERARAEADLERRRLEAVLDALPVGVIIADAAGRMTTVTPATWRIWGGAHFSASVRDYGEWKGWWADTGRPVAADEWALARALRGETVVGEIIDIERFDGTRATIHNNAAPVRDAEGRITGAVVIVVDMSERQQLEAQLRQAQKMEAVGQLAGGIAHDFNNLLTAILGHVELMRDDVDPASSQAADLDVIERAAERGADLTRQLLAFSRRQVRQPVVLDLNAVVVDAEKLLRRVIDDAVTMALDLAPGEHPVRADRGQLEQVVMNLAVNARDAMPEGGTLTIATAPVRLGAHEADALGLPAGDYVRLVVSDTGIGMSDAVRSRVFEPFFTTKEVGRGTGLGLATVYGIVQQSGGAIDVRSAPGAGATFTVHLPTADASPSRPTRRRTAAAPGAGETVLLVEDEPAVRNTLRRALERGNYRVIEAPDGEEALRVWRERRGDVALVITDMRMPGLDGIGLASALRDADPRVRLLFLSGHASDEAPLRPGDAFLAKPFEMNALLQAVRQALDFISA